MRMRIAEIAVIVCTGWALAWYQVGQLKTAEGVLEKYKQALGGADVIEKV